MKKNTAFSLIELSIVILIIGILIAGVTQGSRLVAQMRLASARALTQSSPVSSIKSLSMWLEPTSLASLLDAETEDNSQVSIWYDINPQSSYKINPTQGTIGTASTAKPVYIASCLNSLPCLRFNGTSRYLSFDGTFLVGTNFTIFVVEQRKGNSTYNFYIAGSAFAPNQNLSLGYRSDSTKLTFGQYSNDLDTVVTAFSASAIIPRIAAFTFSTTTGKTLYLNGSAASLAQAADTPEVPVPTLGISTFPGAAIGLFSGGANYYFNGDICEIIMFTRALTNEERTSVQTYLSKKWAIKLS